MGGCASKPKDLDTRKMPPPAATKPHAPPEPPLQTEPQDKIDGDENKERALVGASEPETCEAKPANEEGVPVEVKPTESKVEEKKEMGETVEPKEEKKAMGETSHVVPKEKKEEVAEKQEKEEVAAA